MIKLFMFPAMWHLPNVSIFCMKVETYLRMVNLPFEPVKVSNPAKAPKGKLPYIMDEDTTVSGSGFILDYLKKKYGDPLDKDLTDIQKADGLAIQRMIEEHLYWTIMYSRWIDKTNWPITKEKFFGRRPSFIKNAIAAITRKKIRDELRGQGIGLNSQDEIYQLGLMDLNAIATFLNNRKYILGEEPTSVDATVFAMLANVLVPPIVSPLQDYAKTVSAFQEYYERMKSQYYG